MFLKGGVRSRITIGLDKMEIMRDLDKKQFQGMEETEVN